MGPKHFLPPKIHSNFNSSDKITNFFAIPVISIDATLKIFVLSYSTPHHAVIAYRLRVVLPYLNLFSFLQMKQDYIVEETKQ